MFAFRSVKRGFYNIFFGMIVFLPVFLLGSAVEVYLRGAASFGEGISYHLGAAIIIYISMVIPVILGSVFHSVAFAFVPPTASVRTRQMLAIVSAPLVPSTVIFLDLSGGMALSHFLVATTVATAAYALAVVKQVRNQANVEERN